MTINIIKNMNKKGMFFTLMTIVFLIIFLFMFTINTYERSQDKMLVTEMRIDTMNYFIDDLLRDTERGLYISSFRAMMSIEEYVIVNNKYLDDFNIYFNELVLNGTINDSNATLMINSRFPDWIENIRSKADDLNIYVNISINNLRIYQIDPWNAMVSVDILLNVTDFTGLASWSTDEVIVTSFSIIDFEDPLYIINGRGLMTNKFSVNDYDGNYTYPIGPLWNVSNLLEHVDNMDYSYHPDAPSFLMRFVNNLSSSSCCGIESLVSLKRLEDAGFQQFELNIDSSIIDYHYWTGTDNGDYLVNFTPSWVKFDINHRYKYNITEISYLG